MEGKEELGKKKKIAIFSLFYVRTFPFLSLSLEVRVYFLPRLEKERKEEKRWKEMKNMKERKTAIFSPFLLYTFPLLSLSCLVWKGQGKKKRGGGKGRI